MKKIWLAFFVLFLCAVFFKNNNLNMIISGLNSQSKGAAGELKYRIYLLGILPVGEAVFAPQKLEKLQGNKVYHLNLKAQNLKVFSKLFSGMVTLDSYIDTERLNPVIFKQKIVVVGKKDIDRQVSYDQKNNIMVVFGVKRQIFPDTQDPLSAIFNFRRMDYVKNKNFEININTNQKNYILKGTAEQKMLIIGKKDLKLTLAKAEIKRRDKNPYHQSSVSMWLWQDKENLPLLIKLFAGGVFISAKLTSIN